MAIDTDVPYSPGWWISTLATELHNRRVGRVGTQRHSRRTVQPTRIRPGLETLEDYLRGDPPLREDVHADWAAPFLQWLRMGRMNIAPKLVSATANRMGIRDFRTSSATDELGDVEARNLVRRNQLKMKARDIHDDMLGLGCAYTIVTPPDATRSWSLITAESPLECITAHHPATGATLAGLKLFRDEYQGIDYAYLFLPGELYVAKHVAPATTLFRPKPFAMGARWEWDYDKWDDVPGNKVAMVRFQNKDGLSEFEGQLDTLDRINDKLFNEWWIGKLQAFKQRALELPDEDDDSTPGDGDDDEDTPTDEEWADIFTSAPDAMWKIPRGAKIWESSGVDVRQLIDSIKAELQWLAFTSSKPMHLITPDATNGSAEGASTQKEEHSFEVGDRRDRAEVSWAETMSLAFEFQDMSDRADVSQIEAIWGPLELHSLQERTQAARYVDGILPTEAIYTDVLQYAPADVVERLRSLRGKDALYGAQAAPSPAPEA